MAGEEFLARAVRAGTGAASCLDAEGQVIEALRQRAAHGDAQAMLFLGIRLLRGAGIDKDPRQAYEWLVQAADRGDALAQHLVGVMSRNPARSARYWQRSAEQGHAPAQFCLGLAHVRGSGVPLDAEQGRAWLDRAARQGHLAAIYDLGVLGAGAEQALVDDPDAKLPLFLAKAEAGDALASWLLGQVMQNGQAGAELDVNRVVDCLCDAVAQGFAPAHESLVALATRAAVDETVRERVRQRLGEQAAAGSAIAQLALGELLVDGNADALCQGLHHLHEAAAAGHEQALDQIARVQAELLANASTLRAQAIGAATPDERAALLPQLLRAARGLQSIADGKVVATGPNARVQMQGLYQAAADLGDADAAAQLAHLAQLRGDADWEQAQALAELAGPLVVAQDEPLSPEPEPLEQPEEPHPSIEVQSEALGAALQFAAAHEAEQQVATASPEDAADDLSEEDRAFLGVFKDLTSFEDLKDIPQGEETHAQTESAALDPLAEDEPPAEPRDDAPETATPETAESQADDGPGPSPARKPWWKLW
jgi:TPR repeat protein